MPDSSKGSRRRRCGRASSTPTRTSSSVTDVAPRSAACAAAVRATTMSPRRPSTSRCAQMPAMRRSSRSLISTLPTDPRAAAIRSESTRSSSAYRSTKRSGSASKSIRRRTTSTRSSTSRAAVTSTASPNRSSSCGRSSPSSGFIVPTSTKSAAWVCETPSRSMVTRPLAAASSSTSTRWSARRLTSSM